MSCHVMSRHVTSSSERLLPRHVPCHYSSSRHVTSRHAMSRHDTYCHVTSCHVTSRSVASRSVASHRGTSRHVTSRQIGFRTCCLVMTDRNDTECGTQHVVDLINNTINTSKRVSVQRFLCGVLAFPTWVRTSTCREWK